MKKRHAYSVRKEGDIVELRIYRCQEGREETFRGKARLRNKKEVNDLFEAAFHKGLELPEQKPWFQ